MRLGKWPGARAFASGSSRRWTITDGFPLAVSIEHATSRRHFPAAHRDPFDRMLAAQARIEDLMLVTADPALSGFSGDDAVVTSFGLGCQPRRRFTTTTPSSAMAPPTALIGVGTSPSQR